MTCALGLYAISKEAAVGDTLGKQALYRQLTDDQIRKRGELAALIQARSIEVIDGEIAAARRDRLWARTRECTNVTATESITFCKSIDRLVAEKATVRPAEDIKSDKARLQHELREIETKIAGVDLASVMQKADPATEALAKILAWEPDTVKTRLALMIAVLFELVGLLPWIIHGSHGGKRREPEPVTPAVEPVQVAAPKPVKAAKAATAEPPKPAPIDIPEVDSMASAWVKDTGLVRRKGSYVPAREMFDAFSMWCRLHGHDTPTQTRFGKMMTDLGFERKKMSGSQRYVDVALIPKQRELRVVAG